MLPNTKAIVLSSFTEWDLRYVSHAFSGKTTLEYDNEDLVYAIECKDKYWVHYFLTQGFVNDGSLPRLCVSSLVPDMLKYLIDLGLYIDSRLIIYAAEEYRSIELIDILCKVVGKSSDVIFYAIQDNNESMLEYCFENDYPIDDHLVSKVHETYNYRYTTMLRAEITRREKNGLFIQYSNLKNKKLKLTGVRSELII
jgi:hypothetical protein